MRWWPFDPLFQATSLPNPGWEEVIYASSDKGGTKGDVQEDSGAITVFYQYPPRTADKEDYFTILDGGGYALIVTYHPAGTVAPYSEGVFSRQSRLVEVRGHPARLLEFRKDTNANVDWRDIRWEEKVSGGFIQWSIGNNPLLYSEPEAIEFINQLAERRS